MFSTEKPKLIELIPRGYAVRFDVEESEGPDGEPGYSYEEVNVPDLNYSTIVSGIIRHKYSESAEIAHINNQLNDPEGRADEWHEYQDWRDFAKAYTRETLGIAK